MHQPRSDASASQRRLAGAGSVQGLRTNCSGDWPALDCGCRFKGAARTTPDMIGMLRCITTHYPRGTHIALRRRQFARCAAERERGGVVTARRAAPTCRPRAASAAQDDRSRIGGDGRLCVVGGGGGRRPGKHRSRTAPRRTTCINIHTSVLRRSHSARKHTAGYTIRAYYDDHTPLGNRPRK